MWDKLSLFFVCVPEFLVLLNTNISSTGNFDSQGIIKNCPLKYKLQINLENFGVL